MKTGRLFVCMALAAGVFSAPLASSQGPSEQAIWLKAHNDARSQFGSKPLSWSAQLEWEAKQWAVRLAREQRMRHAPKELRNGNGENLWMGTHNAFTPSEMVGDFLEQRSDFVAGHFPEVSRTGSWRDVGHYTQIVWPETRELGCAKAQGREYDIMVCRYSPAGNQLGTFIGPKQRVSLN